MSSVSFSHQPHRHRRLLCWALHSNRITGTPSPAKLIFIPLTSFLLRLAPQHWRCNGTFTTGTIPPTSPAPTSSFHTIRRISRPPHRSFFRCDSHNNSRVSLAASLTQGSTCGWYHCPNGDLASLPTCDGFHEHSQRWLHNPA
jgi:hypothetical protein